MRSDLLFFQTHIILCKAPGRSTECTTEKTTYRTYTIHYTLRYIGNNINTGLYRSSPPADVTLIVYIQYIKNAQRVEND